LGLNARNQDFQTGVLELSEDNGSGEATGCRIPQVRGGG